MPSKPPRVVLQGDIWRVVALELPDQHSVLRTEYIIEMTEPKDRDALGVQRWQTLNPDKSAMVQWIAFSRKLLDRILTDIGEKPDA